MPLNPSIYNNTQVASANPLMDAVNSMFDPDVKAARERATQAEQTGLAQQQEKLANDVLSRTLPQVNSYLEAGDTQGALAAMQSGRKTLADAGMEVPESPIIRYLEQGDVQTAQKLTSAFMQRMQGQATDPSQVREYQYFQSLTPEEQQKYLTVKRSGSTMNLGDKFVQTDPTGRPIAEFNKGLPPEKDLGYVEESAGAQVRGKAAAEKDLGSSGASVSIKNRADAFFNTLTDPKIDEAIGLSGAVKGTVGQYTGSDAGVLRGRLKRLGSGMVLDAAESLKGALSDRDISFLEATMPSANQSKEVWKDWYESDLVPMLRSRAATAGVAFEDLGIPETFPGEGQATQQSQQGGNTFTSSSGIQFTVE